TFSSAALLSMIDESVHIASYNHNRSEVLMQNVNIYFIKPVPLDKIITAKAIILDIGRKSAKFDVEVYDKNDMVAKALVTCQVFQRN
ncbi:thioesterase, partial [Streptococcus danieliae]|nr:thioesterase [Streptococcus danieliae]